MGGEAMATDPEYEQFFALSVDLLCIAGVDGYFKRVNPAFSRTLGYSTEEILSRPFVYFIHPDDVGQTQAVMAGLIEGKSTLSFENRYRCKDGAIKWLSWNTGPFNEEGIVFAVARDITAKKEADVAILQLNEELKRQTVILEDLNQELESFSYSVSHDLRAPLRGISGFAQALEERAGKLLDPTSSVYLLRVKNAAVRMGLLIDDLLKLSRLNRAEMMIQPVNLSEMADSSVAGLRMMEPGRIVAVSVQEGMVADGDPALLEVLLDNLIGNAWKFTSKNPAATIQIGSRIMENGVTAYFVKDNGVGFDDRYSHKLFGAFQRLHNQMEFPGTGIGLATVQRIVKRHEGEVFAKSVINHGATFEFTLASRALEIPP
jgi:PAS domain S-box-containing protein